TVMTYNAIKSLTIRSGDTDATGKTLYLQTNNAQGRQSVQLAASKNGSTSSTGPTGHPYMKANNYAEQVLWISSNEAVASVDATGLVTAHTGGTATITAGVYGGKVKATCTVNVSAVTGVSLSHTAYTLFTGGTAAETQFTLSAALTGGVSSDELEWTNSDPGAAAMTVAADGRSATIDASGKTVGSTTITAHIKGAPDTAQYKASCTVTVVTIGSVSVSPNSYTIYTLGEPRTVQLAATVTPSAAPVWSSSNPAAATVNQTGLVTAVAPGSATVTATVGGKSGSSTITVKDKIPVTSVTVSGANSLVRTSDKTTVTTQLAATVNPSNATLPAVTWAKTEGSASININASGLVTATAAGSATFTATADGVTSAPYTVTVTDQKVTGITISGENSVLVGNALSLTANVAPSTALNRDVTWSVVSGSEYASVSSVGAVSAKAFGNVTIRASANDGSGKFAEKNILVSTEAGSEISWGGKTWWLADSNGSDYGGNAGSVVLLQRGNVAYRRFATNSRNWEGSEIQQYLNDTFYEELGSYKSKLAVHKGLGGNNRVWLPSTGEIYGASGRPAYVGSGPGELRQLQIFNMAGQTYSNYSYIKTVFNGINSWTRSPYLNAYGNIGVCIVRKDTGQITQGYCYNTDVSPRAAIILNP
uniref:Ig-like domain-containing protein n=1 Tax=Harryflintia acetispora TaxID=1849041 RepID=UPI001897FEF9